MEKISVHSNLLARAEANEEEINALSEMFKSFYNEHKIQEDLDLAKKGSRVNITDNELSKKLENVSLSNKQLESGFVKIMDRIEGLESRQKMEFGLLEKIAAQTQRKSLWKRIFHLK